MNGLRVGEIFNQLILFSSRDRIRTTNNMLGDCYTAAVIEKLSEDELREADNAEDISQSHSFSTVLVVK